VNIKTTLKASVAASAILAVTAPVAYAGNVNDGGSNKVVMSGKVVRGLMYAESGPEGEWFHGDGGSTSSRVNWLATGNINENWSVRAYMSLSVPHSDDLSGASLKRGGEVAQDNGDWGINNTEIKFAHKSMGSLEIGRGSMASNGRSETDYSGIGPAFSMGAVGSASGIPFFDNDATLAFSGTTVGTVFSSFDGLSKLERIRYNLPSFNGLNLAVSTEPGSGGGKADIGGSYTAKFGDNTVKVQAQHNWVPDATADGGYSMSAGLQHPSGASIQGFFGTTYNDTAGRADPEGYGILAGYKAKLISAGTTNFAVQYLNTQDLRNDGDDAEAWMVGATQGLGSGVTVHASYRNISLDQAASAGTDFDDITSFFLGTVVTF
jgi:hypothetical protein